MVDMFTNLSTICDFVYSSVGKTHIYGDHATRDGINRQFDGRLLFNSVFIF